MLDIARRAGAAYAARLQRAYAAEAANRETATAARAVMVSSFAWGAMEDPRASVLFKLGAAASEAVLVGAAICERMPSVIPNGFAGIARLANHTHSQAMLRAYGAAN